MKHHIFDVLAVLFGWPGGILLGNLLANVFWVPLQWLGLHLKLEALHGPTHEKLDAILARLEPCPNCGHRSSEPDLQPSMTAPSIIEVSKNTEA